MIICYVTVIHLMKSVTQKYEADSLSTRVE